MGDLVGGAFQTGQTLILVIVEQIHQQHGAEIAQRQLQTGHQHGRHDQQRDFPAREEVDSVADDGKNRAEEHHARDGQLFQHHRHKEHGRQQHDAHDTDNTEDVRVSDDIGKVVGLGAHVQDRVEEDLNTGVEPDVFVLGEHRPHILQRDLVVLCPGVNSGILLDKHKTADADHTQRNGVEQDQAAPACRAGGNTAHHHGEGQGDSHRSQGGDDAAVGAHLAHQISVIVKSADHIGCAARAAQGVEHAENEGVHEEDPGKLHAGAGSRGAGEHQRRADPHADDADLIGTSLAQLGMGVVDDKAGDQIRHRVNDIRDEQDQADGRTGEAEKVGAVKRQVTGDDDSQTGCGDVRGFPG